MKSLQFDLANHSVKDTIKLLTLLLEKIARGNDRLHLTVGGLDSSSYTCFHASSIPTISIYDYFLRILKYCPCTNECLIALLVYFERMTQENPTQRPSLHVDSYNVHRLIITGLMISSKLYSDVFFTNTRYAKVGGLPVSELNALEVEFLYMNEYNVYVTTEELQEYGDNLIAHYCFTQNQKSIEKKKTPATSDDSSVNNNRKPLKQNEDEKKLRRISALVRFKYE